MRPWRVVELFCCSGGLSEGLRRADLPVSMAFDFDDDAIASHEANTGLRPIKMDARDLLRVIEEGGSIGMVDLFVADPPCTPWSRAGKRLGQADERDMLAVTVALIRLIRPRAWLLANVPGLDDGPNWPTVQRTIGSLAQAYCVDFARLDAADYGTPQHRVRPFWYGHGWSTPCLVWPPRTHGAAHECGATLPGLTGLWPHVTCRQALGHLSREDLGKPVRLRWRACKGSQIASIPDAPARVVGTSNLSDGNVLAHPTEAFKKRSNRPGRKPRASTLDEPAHVVTTRDTSGDGSTLSLLDGPNQRPSTADMPARTLTRNTHGDGALLVHARHPINQLDAPPFCVTTKGDGRGAQGACVLAVPDGHPISRPDEPGHVVPSSQPGNGGAVIEWPWERLATTVTAADRLAPPGHHGKSFLSDNRGHGPNAIQLSEKAAAILQGFPDRWVFSGATKRARWAQIGMAMPPPLGEAVARSIAEQLAAKPTAKGQAS